MNLYMYVVGFLNQWTNLLRGDFNFYPSFTEAIELFGFIDLLPRGKGMTPRRRGL